MDKSNYYGPYPVKQGSKTDLIDTSNQNASSKCDPIPQMIYNQSISKIDSHWMSPIFWLLDTKFKEPLNAVENTPFIHTAAYKSSYVMKLHGCTPSSILERKQKHEESGK